MIKIIKKIGGLFIFIVAFLCLSGCAKYKPKPLERPLFKAEEKKDVKVCAVVLSEVDCRNYFSRRIISKGYQPIQIYIRNNSDQEYVFDTRHLNVHIEERDVVAKELHLDMVKRVAPYALIGLFLGIFFVPAIVEGVKSNQANKSLDRDFGRRVINSNSRIFLAPGTGLNRVMFVRAGNMTSPITCDLINRVTKEKLRFVLPI